VRQVTVTTPEGKGADIAKIAFAVGISEVSVHPVRAIKSDGAEILNDHLEIETATHLAKAFAEELITRPFFNREEYSVTLRQPRSVISSQNVSSLTRPVVEPTTDLFQELWQFSQVTFGFVGRIYLGALLLAFGIIQYQLLFIIAGLLFIPLLPMMLGIGFSVWTRQWRLLGQCIFALAVALALLLAGGVTVALLTYPPLQYLESNSILIGMMISVVVGVAGGLATADDVGRREMIGLAATAQVAIIPVWFGICFVFGFPAANPAPAKQRVLSLLANIATIAVASCLTYAMLRMRGDVLRIFNRRSQ
jgi:hypothetical protein